MSDMISIIIPIYNVEKYIAECLDSVISQSHSELEIICIDDCSSDGSMAIVEQYSKRDQRIRIVRHATNRGLGPARNTGINAATGKYIFFLDSDDMIASSEVLEQLLELAKESRCDVVVGTTEVFPDSEDPRIVTIAKEMAKAFSTHDFSIIHVTDSDLISDSSRIQSVSWGKLISSSFIKQNNLVFIDGKVAHEDEGFLLKMLFCLPSVMLSPVSAIRYRIRENSIMTVHKRRQDFFERQKKHMALNFEDAKKFMYEHDASRAIRCEEFVSSWSRFGRSHTKKYAGCLNVRWLPHNKLIALFGVELYREKVRSGNIKIYRLVGLTFRKEKLSL